MQIFKEINRLSQIKMNLNPMKKMKKTNKIAPKIINKIIAIILIAVVQMIKIEPKKNKSKIINLY